MCLWNGSAGGRFLGMIYDRSAASSGLGCKDYLELDTSNLIMIFAFERHSCMENVQAFE